MHNMFPTTMVIVLLNTATIAIIARTVTIAMPVLLVRRGIG